MNLAINSAPAAFSNSGIIGVAVGPGLMQLTRTPSPDDIEARFIVYTMIASFENV